jgi:hypothetical protein
MASDRVLTIGDAVTLTEWAQKNSRLMWLDHRGEPAKGTARSIGDVVGNFTPEKDVRDAFLRITTAMGFEWFLPMEQAMAMQREGTLVADS